MYYCCYIQCKLVLLPVTGQCSQDVYVPSLEMCALYHVQYHVQSICVVSSSKLQVIHLGGVSREGQEMLVCSHYYLLLTYKVIARLIMYSYECSATYMHGIMTYWDS